MMKVLLINTVFDNHQFCFTEDCFELARAIITIKNQLNDAKARKQTDFQHPNNPYLDSLPWKDIEDFPTELVQCLAVAICYAPESGDTFADFSE